MARIGARSTRVYPEATLQKSFFTWLCYAHSFAYKLAFSIPNGGQREASVGAHLKAQGLKPGVPDIFIAVPRGTFHGLFIEFKIHPNTLTAFQKKWIEALQQSGYACSVCHDMQEAMDTVNFYLKGIFDAGHFPMSRTSY